MFKSSRTACSPRLVLPRLLSRLSDIYRIFYRHASPLPQRPCGHSTRCVRGLCLLSCPSRRIRQGAPARTHDLTGSNGDVMLAGRKGHEHSLGWGRRVVLRVGQGGFESQVCFYPFIGGSSSIPTRSGLNPFMNQVYFHSGPGKALCSAALRRHFREPPGFGRHQASFYNIRPQEGKLVITPFIRSVPANWAGSRGPGWLAEASPS